jgi:ribosome modulation factor
MLTSACRLAVDWEVWQAGDQGRRIIDPITFGPVAGAERRMSDVTSFNPHKEEDEGYLAAEAGQSLSDNIYPCGTIRHEHWRAGWRVKTEEARRSVRLGSGQGQDDEGYLASAAGLSVFANPYPGGTIRHDDWLRGWRIRRDEHARATRLNRGR